MVDLSTIDMSSVQSIALSTCYGSLLNGNPGFKLALSDISNRDFKRGNTVTLCCKLNVTSEFFWCKIILRNGKSRCRLHYFFHWFVFLQSQINAASLLKQTITSTSAGNYMIIIIKAFAWCCYNIGNAWAAREYCIANACTRELALPVCCSLRFLPRFFTLDQMFNQSCRWFQVHTELTLS